jgi:hypothetical protein
MSETYDRDFYAWANEQAALLRAGRFGKADIAHIAEEICPWTVAQIMDPSFWPQ